MSPLNWKGKPYRPVGSTGFIKVYKPDINELMKPLSMKRGLGSAILTGNAVNPQNEPALTPSSTPGATPTLTPTITMTPTLTETMTPTPSVTETLTPTPSVTETLTPTVTPSITASVTPTLTSSPIPQDCLWNTTDEFWSGNTNQWQQCQDVPVSPSVTPTQTITPSITLTLTPTTSLTPTATNPSLFSPSGLTNLQFWVMADSGFTTSSWTNYGLIGTALTQSTAAQQPASTSITLGSWSGTGIQFTGRDNMLLYYTFSSFTASTVFWVGKKNGTGDIDHHGLALYSTGSGFNQRIDINTGTNQSLGQYRAATNILTFSAANGNSLLIEGSGTTSSMDRYRNDSLMTNNVGSFTATTNVGIFAIGSDPSIEYSNNKFAVVEVLVYNRVLDSTEFQQVEDYLKTKYNYSSW